MAGGSKNPLRSEDRDRFIFLRDDAGTRFSNIPRLGEGLSGDGSPGSSARDARLQEELNEEYLRDGARKPANPRPRG